MAILFCDGCDSYAATVDLTKKWRTAESPWVWSSSAGRNGGGAIQAATTGGSLIKPVSAGFTSNTVVCWAGWIKISAAPAATATLWQTTDTGGTARAGIRLSTSGKLILSHLATLSTAATGAINVCDNAWHWIEIYVSESTGGTCKAIVDGVTEWNGTLVTSNGVNAVDSFAFVSVTGVTVTIDDYVIWDDSTGSPQLAQYPLGPRQITTVRPQADGTVGFLTATGGSTHWNQVSEVNADGDTTYVESAVVGDQDLYDFAALGISPATITSVVANAYASNPNPGAINFTQVSKSSATTTVGSTVAAPSAYQTKQQSFPLDPNTSAAWASASAVDAATFGVKVVA